MSQAEDPQEEKKRLLALLLEGSIVTVIDNCEKPLKSDALCTALTEVAVRDRILGSTRTISVPTTTTWIATGNALAIDGDLSSRTLLCTLDPQCERPEEREFTLDLHADVPQRRGELAPAALTIVRRISRPVRRDRTSRYLDDLKPGAASRAIRWSGWAPRTRVRRATPSRLATLYATSSATCLRHGMPFWAIENRPLPMPHR